MRRLKQVIKYGWKHAGDIVESNSTGKSRIVIFADILLCFYKYRMWSNQYVKEKFYSLSKSSRHKVGAEYLRNGRIRDFWQKDFRDNRKFLIKYSNIKYERASLREKRKRAYTTRFNAGKDLIVEYDVNISRQHYLNGTISIGNNVLLAKHVFIDYSGDVVIGNNVRITNGVIIETHYRLSHADYTKPDTNVPTKLEICDGALIGSRAIIMPSCHRIGLNARVGAGAVVTHDVPDYAVAVGVPAKVIHYQNKN